MERTEELVKIITEAQDGVWIPAAIVGSLMTVILVLSGFIVKGIIKENNKKHDSNIERHKENEKLLETAIGNQTYLKVMVGKLDERSESNRDRIKKLSS
jgi:hypothetical protein